MKLIIKSISLLLLPLLLLSSATYTLAAAAPAPLVAPAPAPQEEVKKPGTLNDLVVALETGDSLHDEVANVSEQVRQLTELNEDLKDHEKQLRQILADVPDTHLGEASSAQLLDLQTKVLNDSSALEKNIERLTAGMSSMETLVAKLQDEKVQWIARLQLANELEAPADFVQRLTRAQNDVNGLLQRVRPQRDQLLNLLQRATNLRSKTKGLNNELNTRRARLSHELRQSEGEPLWVLFTRPALNAQAVEAERNAQWLSIANYARSNGLSLLMLALLVFAGAYGLMRGLGLRLEGDATGFNLTATRRVVKHCAGAALLLSLLSVIVFAPPAPSAVYGVFWLCVPVTAALLFQAAVGHSLRFTVWALVFSLLLLQFRILLELTPWIDRLAMSGQLLLVGVALVYDLHLMKRRAAEFLRPLTYALVTIVVAALLAAFYANMVGAVGLARSLRTGVLGSMGFAMLYTALFHVLLGLGVLLLRSSLGQLSIMVQKRREAIEKLLYSLLRAAAVIAWLVACLSAFGVSDQLPVALQKMMTTNIAVGEAHISTGALITAFVCLFATYVAIRLLRALLDDEILPRLRVAQGVAYAVSMLSRYLVAIIGFLFALSAAGIDLSRMTILAGAVGVGIGFGLQNIVNNFVSGLILLIEQPIHVGDLVDTSTASGVVKHIGIRASTITTSHGADVIVPNGQLLAQDLMNWTRSSRSRRIDITLGVAYGSEPQQVQQLLVDAVKDHQMVRSTPQPVAFFMGFGESSLDFRVQVWVTDASDATSISSDLRNSILTILNSKGIGIPFPQRELWLHDAGKPEVLDPEASQPKLESEIKTETNTEIKADSKSGI